MATTSIARDVRITSQASPISYLGPLVVASSTSSANSIAVTIPSFVTAGSHLIIAVSHASGGNVTGASDSRGNT